MPAYKIVKYMLRKQWELLELGVEDSGICGMTAELYSCGLLRLCPSQ
jgi:hypothetical protein